MAQFQDENLALLQVLFGLFSTLSCEFDQDISFPFVETGRELFFLSD